jgi:hypothetical protein
MRTTIAEYALLDQEDRVLDGGAPLHLPALDGRGMHHPDFPGTASRIEKTSVTRISGGLELHTLSMDGENMNRKT